MSSFLGSNKRDVCKVKRWRGFKESQRKRQSKFTARQSVSRWFKLSELEKLLVNCLRSMENQVKDVFTFHKEEKESQIKVTESLEFIQQSLTIVKRSLEKDEIINQLEKTIQYLEENTKPFT